MLSIKAENNGRGGVICTLTDSVTGMSAVCDGATSTVDGWIRANADLLIARIKENPADFAYPKIEAK